MKKLNRKGFTLIELLAVITIMGILMLVAVPAVQRTIRNTRRDTFADTAKQYINAMKNSVVSDDLICWVNATSGDRKHISAVADGTYYYFFNSSENTGKDLMEQGGASSWGNIAVRGLIQISKSTVNNNTKYAYSITMVDGTHGIGIFDNNTPTFVSEENLDRSAVSMSGKGFGTRTAMTNFSNQNKYSCVLVS